MSDPTWETIRDTPNLTYRQFDFWCSKGWIHPNYNHGSTGYSRTMPAPEIHVLALMADLVAAGLKPAAAAPLARQLAAVDVATLGPFHVSRAAS